MSEGQYGGSTGDYTGDSTGTIPEGIGTGSGGQWEGWIQWGGSTEG